MDLYGGLMNLVKVASLLRGDPRSAYLVNEMQNERNENRIREQIYGAPVTKERDGTEISWNGARAMPNGNVTAMLSQHEALPPVPTRRFVPELQKAGLDERRQQLMALPEFQRLAERQMFALPKPPSFEKVDGVGFFEMPTEQGGAPKLSVPFAAKAPEPTELARHQAERAAMSPGDPRIATWDAKIKRLAEGEPKDSPETWSLMTPEQAAQKNLPKGGTYEISTRGQTRAVVAPTKEMGPAAMKLAQAEIGAKSILYGLDKFEEAVKTAPDGAKMEAFFGGLTPEGQKLNTAWTNAALLAKGEDLYNLGVLSGPDLGIIQNALPDPSTRGGALKDKGTYFEAIKQVRDLVNQRLSSAKTAYGGEPSAPAPAKESLQKPKDAPADAKQAKDGKWYSPDPLRPGKYILWD